MRVTELTLTSADEEAVVSGGDQGIRGGLFEFIDELNNPNHHDTNASHAALPLGLVLLRVNEVRAASARLASLCQSLSMMECGPGVLQRSAISSAAESSRGSSLAFHHAQGGNRGTKRGDPLLSAQRERNVCGRGCPSTSCASPTCSWCLRPRGERALTCAGGERECCTGRAVACAGAARDGRELHAPAGGAQRPPAVRAGGAGRRPADAAAALALCGCHALRVTRPLLLRRRLLERSRLLVTASVTIDKGDRILQMFWNVRSFSPSPLPLWDVAIRPRGSLIGDDG